MAWGGFLQEHTSRAQLPHSLCCHHHRLPLSIGAYSAAAGGLGLLGLAAQGGLEGAKQLSGEQPSSVDLSLLAHLVLYHPDFRTPTMLY